MKRNATGSMLVGLMLCLTLALTIPAAHASGNGLGTPENGYATLSKLGIDLSSDDMVTEDHAPCDPQWYVWYPIGEYATSVGFDSKEVDPYLSASQIMDTSNNTYIVVLGFTLKRLLYNKLNTEIQPWNGIACHTGYVELGSDCSPYSINIYRIPKMLIVPPNTYKTDPPFVVFRDDHELAKADS